jgi:hypothetical protein
VLAGCLEGGERTAAAAQSICVGGRSRGGRWRGCSGCRRDAIVWPGAAVHREFGGRGGVPCSSLSRFGALLFGARSATGVAHAWDLTVGRVSGGGRAFEGGGVVAEGVCWSGLSDGWWWCW